VSDEEKIFLAITPTTRLGLKSTGACTIKLFAVLINNAGL
jgi:hypothetical protein